MNKKIWTFLSYLFHPALMPTLGTFVVLWNDPAFFLSFDTEKPWIIVLAVVFITTYILPLFLCWAMVKIGRISSLSNPTDDDRRYMLAFTALCFILAYYCFHNIAGDGQSLKIFLFGTVVAIFITFVTSWFTKVSFHSVGVGGLFGAVIGLMKYTHTNLTVWLIAAFAILLLTCTARYKLKAHGMFEIYLGLIIGITAQALLFFFRIQGI